MNLIITGALGRMGRMLIAQAAVDSLTLAGVTVRPGKEHDVGALLHALGLADCRISTDLEALLPHADAVIDFTTPHYTLAAAQEAARAGVAFICGTTGLSDTQQVALERLGALIPVVWAANFSIGVNMLLGLVQQVAATLDENWDIEITELHHRMKRDAPSGTALALGHAAAEGRRVALAEYAVRGRDGLTGERGRGEIGFTALRGGDVIGEHSVLFAGDGERLELVHKASSRDIYAAGAIKAARWAMIQPPGYYSMRDVLNA